MTARILVLGAGFAGLWSAVGAARALDEFGVGQEAVRLTVVNRDQWHAIRVRNYERDLSGLRVALHEVLEPIGSSSWRATSSASISTAARSPTP